MTKPYIILNQHHTPLTQQCNAAGLLFDHVSHDAGRRVWDSPTPEWEKVALEYVNITFWPRNVHKQSEFRRTLDGSPARVRLGNGTDHPAVEVASPSAAANKVPLETRTGPGDASPLGRLIRFLGGRS